MEIKVPTPEECQKEKRRKIRHFIAGIITGIIVFGLISNRVIWWGADNVQIYTWIALCFGVLSFGFLAMWFGTDFWRQLFRKY